MAGTHKQTSPKRRFLIRNTSKNTLTKPDDALSKSLTITFIYVVFGGLWIVLSDFIVAFMYGEPAAAIRASILKGLFYVAVTAALIFGLIYPTIKKLVELKDTLEKSNSKLETSKDELLIENEKRRNTEHILLDAQRLARVGRFEYDLVNKKLTLSDESSSVFGIDCEEISGMSDAVVSLVHSDDRVAVIKLSREAIAEKKVVEYDCRLTIPGGEERFAHVRFAPVFDDDDKCICVTGMAQDITTRKRAEIALKESERSKSVLISHLPGMAYRCCYDRQWTMLFLSEGCYELTGYRPESFIGNRDLSYNDIICEEYREDIWNKWMHSLAEKAAFKYEYEITTADGRKKWVWEMGQGIFNDKDVLEDLEGIVIDITESKQRFIQIQYMNDHDSLTDVYNRSFFERAKALMDEESKLPLAIIMLDINGVRLINDAFGHAAGDGLITATARLIQGCCRQRDILARTGGDEFAIILPNTDEAEANAMRLSIINACERYNASIDDKALTINLSLGYGVKQSKEIDIDKAENDAEAYMNKRKLLEKHSHHNTILSSIMATLYVRSNETEEHALRIAKLSEMIGNKMGLPQTSLDELQLFSMLHDIGKIGIDDQILNKPSRLNADELEIIKKHSEIGYMIAVSSPEIASVAEYILSHHERWDGKGYPHGLAGEQIPLLSRILAVADAYDAMTENRIYRRAMKKEAALEEIRKNSGSQFDPQIAQIFLENI